MSAVWSDALASGTGVQGVEAAGGYIHIGGLDVYKDEIKHYVLGLHHDHHPTTCTDAVTYPLRDIPYGRIRTRQRSAMVW